VKVGKGIFSVSGWKRNVVTVYVCMCWLSRQRVNLEEEEEEEDVGVWMELIMIIIEALRHLAQMAGACAKCRLWLSESPEHP
jgi:hypothetical protein